MQCKAATKVAAKKLWHTNVLWHNFRNDPFPNDPMSESLNVCMYACMYACMYVCLVYIYVCMQITSEKATPEEVFRADIPGHLGTIRADVRVKNFRQALEILNKKHK